ncbi:hypothetical protein BV22DRAFT_1122291 [Leucogyrophana mollusca]|uniref:Uncharacterized protein n=1 Tax=Leucogyrophana mollusca TaxID=85980 RepID=A0ACB8B6W8_9AGAM|nr:hypothetical protein BV22DRAFT_1122291 [Leucogyrophana mollusca]
MVAAVDSGPHTYVSPSRRALSPLIQSFTYLSESIPALHRHRDTAKPPPRPIHPSPIERLPVEILAHIFRLARPPFGSPTSPSDSPVICRAVCKTWLSVVEEYPRLWDTCCVQFPTNSDEWLPAARRNIQIIDHWFKAASPFPVALLILYEFNREQWGYDRSNYHTLPGNFMIHLLHHRQRIESITVRMPDYLLQDFWAYARGLYDSPVLRYLRIAPHSGDFPDITLGDRDGLPRAMLDHAQLSGSLKGIKSMEISIPWHRLTSLDLDLYQTCIPALHFALQRCTAIKQLSIKMSFPCFPGLDYDMTFPSNFVGAISLPHLEVLRLCIDTNDSRSIALIDALQHPPLQVLSITRYTYPFNTIGGPVTYTLTPFLSPSLHSLSVDDEHFDLKTLLDNLSKAPNLETLEVGLPGKALNAEFFRRLTATSDSGELLCSTLQSMTFRWADADALDRISKMIQSRAAAGTASLHVLAELADRPYTTRTDNGLFLASDVDITGPDRMSLVIMEGRLKICWNRNYLRRHHVYYY